LRNLMVVFGWPIEGPLVRHGIRDAPLRGEAIGALMLAVEAPSGFSHALESLGFAPALGARDYAVLWEAWGLEAIERRLDGATP
jgi:hypothetical protein